MSTMKRSLGIVGFALIAVMCNQHLFFNADPTLLVFDAGKVADGEWWRLITHPFVHVSWYHLVLDYTALLLLWNELRLLSAPEKFLAATTCAAASLIFAFLTSADLAQYGLCGFSGTAHGLTLFLGVHWLTQSRFYRKPERHLLAASGLLFVCASLGKSLFEATTGTVLFSNMHLGSLGVPIVESHLGGILGGLAAALVWTGRRNRTVLRRKSPDKIKRFALVSCRMIDTASRLSNMTSEKTSPRG